MRSVLGIVAGLVLLGALVYVIVGVRGCESLNFGSGGTIVMPRDTNYAPVEYDEHRAASVPFVDKKTRVLLPDGVRERDVERVVSVSFRDVSGARGDTLLRSGTLKRSPIDIIELKNGEVFVRRDTSIERIVVTRFTDPIFSLGWRFGAGGSLGFGDRLLVSPAVVLAPVEWFGWLQAPMVSVDLSGVGIGGQFQLYHDIYLGGSYGYGYDGAGRVRAGLNFMF